MKNRLKIIEEADKSGLWIDLDFSKVGKEIYDIAKQQNLEIFNSLINSFCKTSTDLPALRFLSIFIFIFSDLFMFKIINYFFY